MSKRFSLNVTIKPLKNNLIFQLQKQRFVLSKRCFYNSIKSAFCSQMQGAVFINTFAETKNRVQMSYL